MRDSRMRALKCSVLFVEIALATHLGRSLAGSLVGYAYGFSSTTFPYFKIWDPVPDTASAVVAISLAPTLFSLLSSLTGASIIRRARSESVRLFGFYLAGFGAVYGLSDLIAIKIDGSISGVAQILTLPEIVQWAICVNSALALAVVMWIIGRRLQPPLSTVAIPFIAGGLVTTAVYAPVPWGLVMNSWIGSAPWVVAIVAAVVRGARRTRANSTPAPDMRLASSAWLFPLPLILFVRLMLMTGVPLG